MENYNMRVHQKNPIFRGGHEKPIYRGNCMKWGAWTVCIFRGGGLGKKEGVF